jgi:hypothetical protein
VTIALHIILINTMSSINRVLVTRELQEIDSFAMPEKGRRRFGATLPLVDGGPFVLNVSTKIQNSGDSF